MTIVSCYHFRMPRGAAMREIRIFSSSCLDSPVKGLYSSLAIILGGGGVKPTSANTLEGKMPYFPM